MRGIKKPKTLSVYLVSVFDDTGNETRNKLRIYAKSESHALVKARKLGYKNTKAQHCES